MMRRGSAGGGARRGSAGGAAAAVVPEAPGVPSPMAALKGNDGMDRHVDDPPLFRIGSASDTLCLALKSDGAPERKIWDAQKAFATSSLFRLKAVTLPPLEERPKDGGTSYSRGGILESCLAQLSRSADDEAESAIEAAAAPKGKIDKTKRSQRYFKLLMQQHTKRQGEWAAHEEGVARDKAEEAALWARRRVEKAAKERERVSSRQSRRRSTSTTDDSSDENMEEEDDDSELSRIPEDVGPLVPYDGTFEVEIEIVMGRAPGLQELSREEQRHQQEEVEAARAAASVADAALGEEPEKEGQRKKSKDEAALAAAAATADDQPKMADALASNQEADSDDDEDDEEAEADRGDLYEELEQLKEEMGVDDEAKSDDSDDMPAGLQLKGTDNVWDNPMPRWSLGIGGSVFFIPDAERYAHGASLPPPPPPSLQGRRRLRIKPRLPLEISHNRYRDEYPNIWPEQPWSPALEDFMRFESKLLTLDFYKGCNKALTSLPQQVRESESATHRRKFGAMVARETKRSQAWTNFNHREKLKKKAAEQKAKDDAHAAQARAEKERKAATARAALG